MKCPNCNQDVTPGASHCWNCRYSFIDGTRPVVVAYVNPKIAVEQPSPNVQPYAELTQPADTNPTQASYIEPQVITRNPTEVISNVPNSPYESGYDNTSAYISSAISVDAPAQSALPADVNERHIFRGALAIASIMFGLIGLLVSIVPVYGILLGMFALGLGIIAVTSKHKILAIIGIILATFVFGLSIFIWTYQKYYEKNQPSTATYTPVVPIN